MGATLDPALVGSAGSLSVEAEKGKHFIIHHQKSAMFGATFYFRSRNLDYIHQIVPFFVCLIPIVHPSGRSGAPYPSIIRADHFST